jgi:hypothetical protein
VVGEERETRDGHYTYGTVPPFDAIRPLTCYNQTGVFHWMEGMINHHLGKGGRRGAALACHAALACLRMCTGRPLPGRAALQLAGGAAAIHRPRRSPPLLRAGDGDGAAAAGAAADGKQARPRPVFVDFGSSGRKAGRGGRPATRGRGRGRPP